MFELLYKILISPIQAVLYHHRRTPHTIVLDSRCPDLAPHIVITPPDDDSEIPWVAHNNTAGSQTSGSLCVPPFYMSTSRLPTYYEWVEMFYPCPAVQLEDPKYSHYSYFSLRSLREYVCHPLLAVLFFVLFISYSLSHSSNQARSTACDRLSPRNHAAMSATTRLLIRSAVRHSHQNWPIVLLIFTHRQYPQAKRRWKSVKAIHPPSFSLSTMVLNTKRNTGPSRHNVSSILLFSRTK